METISKELEFEVEKAKEELISVSKLFYSRGWMMGTSGNLSIFIPENRNQISDFKFLITASGKNKGELTKDNFILVDQNGKKVFQIPESNPDTTPSAETILHSTIYKQTNAKAIYHIHTTNITLLSMYAGKIQKCGLEKEDFIECENLEMLKGLGFKTHETKVSIPIINNNQNMDFISNICNNYLIENIPGLILRGHGIYAWGKTPEEAKRHIEIFEFLFEYKVKELMIN